MGIGVGILLVVVGLILILRVVPDIPHVNDPTLGWILLIVGIVGIVLVLILNAQRSRTTHVEERRYDDGGRRV